MLPVTLQYCNAAGAFRAPGPDAGIPGVLDILDQTRLPQECRRLQLADPQAIHDAIKTLAVRGAPAIGCAAAIGLAVCAQRLPDDGLFAAVEKTAAFLDSPRPTAVNLHWALTRCCHAASKATEPREIRQILLDEALAITAEDVRLCAQIGENGAGLLRDGMTVLTHCNAGALATAGIGTALAPIYAAQKRGIAVKVFSDETRPLLQGARLTAWELAQSGVEVTTICDSMAAQVMREGRVSLVIVGADRVAANGDAANKIGTYSLAVNARYHQIPFYVAMPYSTLDRATPDGSRIVIEQRPGDEIFHCPGAQVYNPAFDVTPHELITGFITERGILKP